MCGQQAEGGVSPTTLLISRHAAPPRAAMPDHGCFKMPLASCLSPEFVCASQEERARADLALESGARAGSSDKHGGHGALLWLPTCDSRALPGCAHHPCLPSPWPSHLQGVRSTSQSHAENHRFPSGTSHPSECKHCHPGLRSQHATRLPWLWRAQAARSPHAACLTNLSPCRCPLATALSGGGTRSGKGSQELG